MEDNVPNKSFDTYKIGGKTYIKDTYLGPKSWDKIQVAAPGRFVDILEAKFSQTETAKKININK